MTDRLSLLSARVSEAVDHAPALAARLQAAGLQAADLAQPGELDRLPVLGKATLMALQQKQPPFAGFLSVPIEEVAQVFVSPGPIFEPVLVGEEAHGFDLMFAKAGIGPGDIVLNTWSYHLVPAGLLFAAGARATGATVVPSGPGQTELQVRLIAELGVTVFLGSTAYFEKVAAAYAEQYGGTKGTWSIKRAFLGGEPGDWMAKRRRLEQEHSISTHSAYGTADLGMVGYEDGGPGYLCAPERLVQICDPGSGAPLPLGTSGEIVVTTLARGWPMIRFGTGDLARALEFGADGFVHRMSGIEGRVGDGVKVREIFLYRAQTAMIARELNASEVRIGVTRKQGEDHITLEIYGPQLSDKRVRDVFQRITRLRPDTIRWTRRFTIGGALDDTREF